MRRRIRWVCFLVLTLASCGMSATPGETKAVKGSAVIGLQEPKLDFGAVVHGRRPVKPFRIYNDGDGALTIERIRSSCACYVAEYPQEAVPAGGYTVIKVKFLTSGIQGPKEGKLFIHSNSARDPVFVLPITGEVSAVPAELQVLPGLQLDFGTVAAGASAKRTLVFENLSDRELELSLPETNGPVEVICEKKRVAPGESTSVDFLLNAPGGEPQAMRGEVCVKTSFPLHAAVSISWTAQCIHNQGLLGGRE